MFVVRTGIGGTPWETLFIRWTPACQNNTCVRQIDTVPLTENSLSVGTHTSSFRSSQAVSYPDPKLAIWDIAVGADDQRSCLMTI